VSRGQLELLGQSRLDGCPLYLVAAEDLSRLTADLGVEKPFAMLLAGDALNWDEAALQQLAQQWIRGGLAYASCWGNGCEWVHDSIDSADLALEAEHRHMGVVMTSWHDREPITSAVYDLAELAFADEKRFSRIRSRIAVVVGDAGLAGEVGTELQAYVGG
jgi:hypothetical protein